MPTTAAQVPQDERIGHLAPIEAAMLASLERQPARVIRIRPMTRLELDRAEVADERKDFIERRTAELLANSATFGNLVFEVVGGEKSAAALAALCRAHAEQGQCWDGTSAFGDLMHDAARAQATDEWKSELLAKAPECSECYHSVFERDPHGTGDSPDGYACTAGFCPWGKK